MAHALSFAMGECGIAWSSSAQRAPKVACASEADRDMAFKNHNAQEVDRRRLGGRIQFASAALIQDFWASEQASKLAQRAVFGANRQARTGGGRDAVGRAACGTL
eukprot:6787737-Alexandrium_andersonii.AAC.1